MDESLTHRPFPRIPLIGAGVLIGTALFTVAVVRLTGMGAFETPPAQAQVTRELRFDDRPDGGVIVRDARADRPVTTLEPGSDGFVRATLRSLVRERRLRGIGPEVPFRLSATAAGRLTLEDPTTGRSVDLAAFGSTNAAAFARLLAAAEPPR